MSGRIVCATLPITTWHAPIAKARISNMMMSRLPKANKSAMMPAIKAWSACEHQRSLARSYRSTNAPTGSDSASQGRYTTARTLETIRGSLVIVMARRGRAAANTP
ncbi:hypothetical protein GCM10009602_32880 [Nocardiopsis tropica]